MAELSVVIVSPRVGYIINYRMLDRTFKQTRQFIIHQSFLPTLSTIPHAAALTVLIDPVSMITTIPQREFRGEDAGAADREGRSETARGAG